jgi:hypothetical protein
MTWKTFTLSTTPIAAALAACLAFGLGGCMTTRTHLATSADDLEHNTNVLADDARTADFPSEYVHDVHVLSDDARNFRRTVEDRSSSDSDVGLAFERLRRSYHVVRDDVDHSDSRTARADLQPVTDSYRDIEQEIGGRYPERSAAGY